MPPNQCGITFISVPIGLSILWHTESPKKIWSVWRDTWRRTSVNVSRTSCSQLTSTQLTRRVNRWTTARTNPVRWVVLSIHGEAFPTPRMEH